MLKGSSHVTTLSPAVFLSPLRMRAENSVHLGSVDIDTNIDVDLKIKSC